MSAEGPRRAVEGRRAGVCVVGSGTRFLSGISYYTQRLANALAETGRPVSLILMRQLLPTRLYPGRERVGQSLTRLQYDPRIRLFDGIDWFWGLTIVRALALLMRARPRLLLLEWWSGTVLHSYLALALAARLLGARIVIEFHEVQDTGELEIAPARAYVRALAPLLVRMASGYVVHSDHDRVALRDHYSLGDRPIAVIPHGPFDHHRGAGESGVPEEPPDGCNILFFGTIRPYKGLEDLIAAFDSLSDEEAERCRLTVVGETWEGWTLPADRIAASSRRDRIAFVNRYVPDEEVDRFFSEADVVALPYHRSSASGPLHIAMAHGLPTVVTRVGGLTQAAADYEGAVWAPPADPAALADALRQAVALRGTTFEDPHSWEHSVELLEGLEHDLA